MHYSRVRLPSPRSTDFIIKIRNHGVMYEVGKKRVKVGKRVVDRFINLDDDSPVYRLSQDSEPDFVPIGPTFAEYPDCAHQDVFSWIRGLRKRILHGGKPKDSELQRFKAFVTKHVKQYKPLPHLELSQDLLNYWLDRTDRYTLKQKEQFRQQYQVYLDGEYKRDLFSCKSFIKKEFYGERKEARIINSRSDVFKCIVAPFIKMIEERVYDDHFIKHLKPVDVARKMMETVEGADFFYETDYSSFESSFQSNVADACELVLFKRLLCNNPDIYALIERCYFKYMRVKYTDVVDGEEVERTHRIRVPAKQTLVYRNGLGIARVPVVRMSGDMWTSLANGFTNKMLVEYVASCTAQRLHRPVTVKYLVEGDDGLIAPSSPLDFEIVSKLGFILKCEKVTHVNECSFCSMIIGPNGKLYPQALRVLNKINYTFDDYIVRNVGSKSKKYKTRCRELMRACALSLLATSPGVPVLQPLALRCLELAGKVGAHARDFDWWEREFFDFSDVQPAPITDADRKFFAEHFNISISQQAEIESIISSMDCDSLLDLKMFF